MKKIILIFSLITLVIFIILLVGQSSFFLHSNILRMIKATGRDTAISK